MVPGNSYGRRRTYEETGSGVIVQFNGKMAVLTNLHVVKDATTERISIRLGDGRELHPTRVYSDAATDVAVLEVAADRLIPARVGDSNQTEIGDFVVAYGSPFGLSHSVTFGIISAKARRTLELSSSDIDIQNFLQTDAAINPGNSGGPLLNLRGEVIGINTAIASSSGGNEGIGFSIPINMAVVVAQQLMSTGRVARAYLGVHVDGQFNAETATRLGLERLVGARVTGITPRSPAENAEIRPNDVILTFDGVTIEDSDHLVNLVKTTDVGKSVPVVVVRDRQRRSLHVTLTDRSRFEIR